MISGPEIQIEHFSGDALPLANWRDSVPGKRSNKPAAEKGFDALLDEEHHRWYGRPWSIGRGYFDYLREIGLSPSDRVLDFGCGVGRLGVWLTGHLDAGNYHGVDSHLPSLEAFAGYEVPLHGLAAKRPRLALDAAFAFGSFGVAFDWVLDFFSSAHLTDADLVIFYDRAASTMTAHGRLVMASVPRILPPQLVLERTDLRPAFLLDRSAREGLTRTDNFHVFRRR